MNTKISKNQEIGDHQFLLEVNVPEDIQGDHPDVGKMIRINQHANETLRDLRGYRAKITGVIIKKSQVAGYRVLVPFNNKEYIAPKKDFWVDQKMVEDIHLQSSLAVQTRQILSHWEVQRDYYGPSWDGIESLHFELAKITDNMSVEFAGWYKYPSSTRKDMDGKDWRLIISDKPDEAVCINCHSLLHDNTWSLATTVYSTRQIDLSKILFHRHPDHWQRVFLWTIQVAKALSIQGYDYKHIIKNLQYRMWHSINTLLPLKNRLFPQIASAYHKVMGTPPDPPEVSLGLSKLRMKSTSIGKHEPPSDERTYSIITIDPITLRDLSYLKWVMAHELIHYILSTSNLTMKHGEQFQKIANLIGLPMKYQN